MYCVQKCIAISSRTGNEGPHISAPDRTLTLFSEESKSPLMGMNFLNRSIALTVCKYWTQTLKIKSAVRFCISEVVHFRTHVMDQHGLNFASLVYALKRLLHVFFCYTLYRQRLMILYHRR